VVALTKDVSWRAKKVKMTVILLPLLPSSGPVQNLFFEFNESRNGANFSSSNIPIGCYTDALKLQDNGYIVAGAVEVFRIGRPCWLTNEFRVQLKL